MTPTIIPPRIITGRVLRAGRHAALYSASELADAVGVTRKTIERWEGCVGGTAPAKPDAVFRIALAFAARGIALFDTPTLGVREMTVQEWTAVEAELAVIVPYLEVMSHLRTR